MAAPAPGQSAPQTEALCYNCGSRGHWLVACPEPTRQMPAGLQRSKDHEQMQATKKSHSTSDKKGLVVTRYPPPPGILPPPPPPGQGPLVTQYPATGPGSYQPVPPPPPPTHAFPPYPPVSTYSGSHFQPAAPPVPLQHGHYPSHPLPPPPPAASYGPPSLYGQTPFPPFPSGYAASPPPPRPYAPGGYRPHQYAPPPVVPPGVYPPPYSQAPSAPPPMVGHNGYPTDPGCQFGPGGPGPYPSPQNGRVNNGPTRFQPAPPPPSYSSQRGRGNYEKGLHRKRDMRNRVASVPSPSRNRLDKISNVGVRLNSDTKDGKVHERELIPTNKDVDDSIGDGEFDFASEKDINLVFPRVKGKPADPVGIPLSHEYNDDPTIPPAYNAKCIKSKFFTPENKEEFSRSIRDTERWEMAKLDPVFFPYDGMDFKRFPGNPHEYSTYSPSAAPPLSVNVKMPPLYKYKYPRLRRKDHRPTRQLDDGSADAQDVSSHVHLSARDSNRDDRHWGMRDSGRDSINDCGKRNLDDRREFRDAKRRKPSSTREEEAPPISPSVGDAWAVRPGETDGYGTPCRSVHNGDAKSSSSVRSDLAPPNTRHDSGYHSSQSQETTHGKPARRHSSGRDGQWGNRREREYKARSAHKTHAYKRSRSRSRSPTMSSSDRSRGRTRTRSPRPARRRSGQSPLSMMERELLGLVDDSEAEGARGKPRATIATTTAMTGTPRVTPKKSAKKQVKVAAAYDRRW